MSIDQLEEYFKTTELPATLQLAPGVKIANMELFLTTQLQMARSTLPNSQIHGACFERLIQLKQVLSEKV